MLLFCIGMANLLLQKNMIKKILGVNIMNSGACLFLASIGCQGLALVGVAASVGATALALVLTARLYERCDTLNIDEALVILARRSAHKTSPDDLGGPEGPGELDDLEGIDLSFELMGLKRDEEDKP